MKFVFELTRSGKKELAGPRLNNSWWRTVFEPWTGAWQHNVTETQGSLLGYPTLFACVSRISQDIAKLPFELKQMQGGIWTPTENSSYSPVLRKPNHFQTAQQFRESWVLSKQLQGNTYVLLQRDNREVVSAMYVLDPTRVAPKVAKTGDVFYELWNIGWHDLPPLPEGITTDKGNVIVPARDIIHDRANTFHHPLIGVPPLAAAYWPTAKNLRILKNAAEFFGNRAQPGGILTAPAGMSDEDAATVKSFWDDNFVGEKAGNIAVIGADMKFQAFSINAVDSQLVEQMKYSDEQITQPFGIKPYKIGIGNPPAGWKSDDVNVEYYGDALSPLIESMENLLDEGLKIKRPLGVELNIEPLWRMDEGKMAEVETKLVGGKVKTPDEARRKFNLAPTGGGDVIWGQHQDFALGTLRDRLPPDQVKPLDPPAEDPEDNPEESDEDDPDTQDRLIDMFEIRLWNNLSESHSLVKEAFESHRLRGLARKEVTAR